nr:protein argonaute-2-like [Drosophila kikkawai]
MDKPTTSGSLPSSNSSTSSSSGWQKAGVLQQQKTQGNTGWGCRQGPHPTKAMDKPTTSGSLPSSNSSTSSSSGWQKAGVLQQRTQGSQRLNSQQGSCHERVQDQSRNYPQQMVPIPISPQPTKLTTSGSLPSSNSSTSSSSGWQKAGVPQQRTQESQRWNGQQGSSHKRVQDQPRNYPQHPQGQQMQHPQRQQMQHPQGQQMQHPQRQQMQHPQGQQMQHPQRQQMQYPQGQQMQYPQGQQMQHPQGQQMQHPQGQQMQHPQGQQMQHPQGQQMQHPQGEQMQHPQGQQMQHPQGQQMQHPQGQQMQNPQRQQMQHPQGQQMQYPQGQQMQHPQGQQMQHPQGQQMQHPQGQQMQHPQGQQMQNPQGQQMQHSQRQQMQHRQGEQMQHPQEQQMQHPQGQQMLHPQGQQMQHPQGQQQQRPQVQQQRQQYDYQSNGPVPKNGSSALPLGPQDQKQQDTPKGLPQRVPIGPLPSQPAGIIKRGTIGKPGQVAVNYLDINMDKMPEIAFHYDVKIEPERPKKFWRRAFEQFRVNQLGGAIAAYDGRASCYSVDRLNTKSSNGEVTVIDIYGRSIRYTVEIKETNDLQVDLKSLRSYMSERIFDKPMRAMQCLEVVMAVPCHKKAIRSGRSFFKMSAPGQRRELEDGYEALVGLYQAFILGDRPFFNVDISHKSFPMEMSVLEYLERFALRQRINQSTDLGQLRGNIESFLKGLSVIYTPPKCFDSLPHCWKINGLSRDPASKQTFQLEGKVLTIADYFRSRNFKLQFPQLHCLHVGPPVKNIMVPIELCHIEGGQALNRKDGATQVSNMIKFAATSTNERKAKIMDLLKFFEHNLDPTISRFGIRIANDFITVHTRTLVPPQVEYQGKKCCSVRNGSWRMDNMRFLEPKAKAHKWAILYFDPPFGRKMPYNQVADFEQRMLAQSKTVNVSLDKKAEIWAYRDERKLDQCFLDLRGQCDLAFVIIPQHGVTYSTIKQKAELQHGILTQCIKQFTVERKLNPQTIGNILLKVNSKLNGINHKLKDDPRQPMLKNAMFLGADVSHPSPDQREIPSVVGVAASHDRFGGAYNMQYRLQRSTLEEIEDMEAITLEHLRVYQKYHNEYPDYIIYYRDGVSDGQFPKIKNEEIRGIKAACRQIGIRPQICCIIVVKRHHTRFFPMGQPSQYNKFNNVDPGTVVDRTIVHPNEVQFFMVSHQSIQGTAKPTRYNVIENTGKLDIDLLQQLTFNLCHMFPRCTRSVSYPAPAYLAHLVAARGRHYLSGTERFQDLKREYNKRKIVAEFMNTNPMFFV